MSLLQTIRSLEGGKRPVKGGLDIPAVHGGYPHLAHSRRSRLRTGSTTSPTGRVGIAVFDPHSSLLVESAPIVDHQPIERGHGAVRVEGDLPSPKATICAQHKRLGLLTARNRAEQPRGLAWRQASGPTLRVCATQSHYTLSPHMQITRGHKRPERGGQRSFEPVGSVRPTEDERN